MVADALREETVLVEQAVAPAPAPAPPPVAAEPPVQAVEEPPEIDLDLLMSGTSAMSGDLSGIVEERRAAATERATDEPVDRKDEVIEALHTIYDPEIPVDIYELGLIYDVDVQADDSVDVRMTLTSPNCPAAQSLPAEVETKVAAIQWVQGASVEVVFDPPWTPELMSEEARLELNV